MLRRPSATAQRLSEICDHLAPKNVRKSRLDGPKMSFIPRPSGRSLERVSGVQPLEGGTGYQHPGTARHRSADAGRIREPTSHSRPRSTYMTVKETPSQKTPLARQLLHTPMSAMSSRPRTPSNEGNRNRLAHFERALLAMPTKDARKISEQAWQRRTSERVVEYLRQHPTACSLLPASGAPLRPVTIKLFVDLVNCLLGLPNHINNTNYVLKLPATARKILYPGVMTKSWLKSVNAMHTYPNMLAFLAYLVDYSRAKDIIAEGMTLSVLSGEEKLGEEATMKQQYYLDCWEVFQNPAEPDYRPNLEAYVAALKDLHGISDNEIMKLREKITELTLLTSSPAIMEARNLEAALRARPGALEEQAQRLRQGRSELERALRAEQSQRANARATLEAGAHETKRLESEIRELQRNLSEQQMTTKQKKDVLAEVDTILKAVESKRELVNEIQMMSYKKDLELGHLQKQALVASIAMNRSLVAVGLSVGFNLNEFTIDERDLLAGNALEANKERMDETLASIKTKLEEQLEAIQQNKDAGACRKQQVKIQLESERQRVQGLRSALSALEEQSAGSGAREAGRTAAMRAQARAAGQRAEELARKGAGLLRETQETRHYWEDQEEKWRLKLEQLRGEEDMVMQTCEARARALVAQYVAIAKSVLNKN